MLDDFAYHWWLAIVWFSEHAVEPALRFTHLGTLLGEPDDIAAALLIAALQIAIIGGVFRPLETLLPAQRWQERKFTRVDFRFTVLLAGLGPLLAFFVLSPFAMMFSKAIAAIGLPFDGLLHYFSWIQQHPYLAFGLYYALNDLAYYWMHRAQHAIPWWWVLHSMHHSQRQVNCWTNARVNYLDVILTSCLLATVGMIVGVEVGEFAWLVLISELVQSLAHTNTRLGFGRVVERLFITPRFHRLHHMLVEPQRPYLHNCNYGQVLAIWDNLFGTALYGEPVHDNGVGDPIIDADNDHGAFAMQWHCARRFLRALGSRAGWKRQSTTFDAVADKS